MNKSELKELIESLEKFTSDKLSIGTPVHSCFISKIESLKKEYEETK